MKDPLENMGAQMVRGVEARRRSRRRWHHHGDRAGPGHLSRGREERHHGRESDGDKRGIDKAVEAIVASLKTQSKP